MVARDFFETVRPNAGFFVDGKMEYFLMYPVPTYYCHVFTYVPILLGSICERLQLVDI